MHEEKVINVFEKNYDELSRYFSSQDIFSIYLTLLGFKRSGECGFDVAESVTKKDLNERRKKAKNLVSMILNGLGYEYIVNEYDAGITGPGIDFLIYSKSDGEEIKNAIKVQNRSLFWKLAGFFSRDGKGSYKDWLKNYDLYFGRLLGYPECCIKAYANSTHSKKSTPFTFHFWCKEDCEESERLEKKYKVAASKLKRLKEDREREFKEYRILTEQ